MELYEIKSRYDLSKCLGIKLKELTYVLYGATVDSFYETFSIPKKSGGERSINAPTGALKTIQKKLAEVLYTHQDFVRKKYNIKCNISHAFEKQKNIITNADIHRNKRILAKIDLKDFFDKFHFGRVCGFFHKNRELALPYEMAVCIAQLTCYKGKLPQGAPTSPIITNMIFQICDMRLLSIAKKYKLDYSRYADDLFFSTNDKNFLQNWETFYKTISAELKNFGFDINEKKTCVQYRDSRQTVTGLVVNKRISVKRDYSKKVRAMANSLYRNGTFYIDGSEGTIDQLEGRFAFINQVEKANNQKDTSKKHKFWNLNSREKQYQKFLFFKYFYNNDKPLIITEGKTDIRYIQAALKNLYNEYPDLIHKNENGKFSYKFSFLKRTKRLAYFFNVASDGADTMKNIYNFYVGENSYWSTFSKIPNSIAKNPVIMVFDNEMNNKDKPLKKFLDSTNNKKRKEELNQSQYLKILKSGNLFLVTNPLVKGLQECEIEDLFDEKVLQTVIGGKTFARNEPDPNKHYGKEIFSNYIYDNYTTINFDNFKPLLNVIVSIVKNYNCESN